MPLRTKRSTHTGAKADETVELAWRRLPDSNRQLLESIGAHQWQVVRQPLGLAAEAFLLSAGMKSYPLSTRTELDQALGIWLRELQIVLINESHPKLAEVDDVTREEFIARIAWHEWGHALSIARCSEDDVAAGARLLQLAPAGIRERVREAGYRPREYTHEVIAETYALLMLRRLKGGSGQPSWLHDEIYSLLKAMTEWND
ncbi:MAG TPA: hypothetical protein VFY36_11295 [Solirubrobacteraceae bacterium]|nr:hypothetical protein [Solirubrobacteraceae bacterium]